METQQLNANVNPRSQAYGELQGGMLVELKVLEENVYGVQA